MSNYTDTFNRADSASLGSDWVGNKNAQTSISGNAAQMLIAGLGSMVAVGATAFADGETKVQIKANGDGSGYTGALIRADYDPASGNGSLSYIGAALYTAYPGPPTVYRCLGGQQVQVTNGQQDSGDGTQGMQPGRWVGIKADGPTVTATLYDTDATTVLNRRVVTLTDGPFDAGHPGLLAYNNAYFDEIRAVPAGNATALGVAGPATCVKGQPADIMVSVGALAASPITVTPACVDGGTFSPASASLQANSSVDFEWTPSAEHPGTTTITATSGGLSGSLALAIVGAAIKAGFDGDSNIANGFWEAPFTLFLGGSDAFLRPVTIRRHGLGGSTSTDWQPGNPSGLLQAAYDDYVAQDVDVVLQLIGTNNAGSAATPVETYRTHMANRLDYHFSRLPGVPIVLLLPFSPCYDNTHYPSAGGGGYHLMEGYHDVLRSLDGTRGGLVFATSGGSYATFATTHSYLSTDDTHVYADTDAARVVAHEAANGIGRALSLPGFGGSSTPVSVPVAIGF